MDLYNKDGLSILRWLSGDAEHKRFGGALGLATGIARAHRSVQKAFPKNDCTGSNEAHYTDMFLHSRELQTVAVVRLNGWQLFHNLPWATEQNRSSLPNKCLPPPSSLNPNLQGKPQINSRSRVSKQPSTNQGPKALPPSLPPAHSKSAAK